MIYFDKFELENGLKVIVHNDPSTPIVAVNLLYDVGARDEDPERTGFAHLFEHLMFGGSVNIPKYDTPLEMAGGENNAFTTNDITNYYLTIPKDNLELAFWLESDRMLGLAFSETSLDVQRNVVIEEFKQSYLNQPYGDVWLLLRPLAYTTHPYMWSTIGKEISHIEKATMEDVKAFYDKHYNPCNAILTVAGDVNTEEVKLLAERWFGSINPGKKHMRTLPREPIQKEERRLSVERDVPVDAIYKVYHMYRRNHQNYHASDLISDIFSNGDSSRLYNSLVKEQRLFSNIDAYITGNIDEGLFIFSGKLVEGVAMEAAEYALNTEIQKLSRQPVSATELTKVKNKIESNLEFSKLTALNKAMNLSLYELLGDAAMINQEENNYNKVTTENILEAATEIFRQNNCSTLCYHSG
jgi:predicted Zn-dependent peptidase